MTPETLHRTQLDADAVALGAALGARARTPGVLEAAVALTEGWSLDAVLARTRSRLPPEVVEAMAAQRTTDRRRLARWLLALYVGAEHGFPSRADRGPRSAQARSAPSPLYCSSTQRSRTPP